MIFSWGISKGLSFIATIFSLDHDILSCKYRKVVPFDVIANSFRRSERLADNIDSIVLDMIAL